MAESSVEYPPLSAPLSDLPFNCQRTKNKVKHFVHLFECPETNFLFDSGQKVIRLVTSSGHTQQRITPRNNLLNNTPTVRLGWLKLFPAVSRDIKLSFAG